MITLKENYNSFFGSMVSNPFEGDDPDSPITVQQGVFRPNDPPGIHRIENMAHYRGVLLSVHFYTDDWTTLEGSAVMVAPGIAFAAYHVFSDLMRHIMAGQLSVLCIGYTSSGPRFWRPVRVTTIDDSDIVILTLEYGSAIPADRTFTQAMITTRLPPVGEEVMITGTRAATNEYVEADEHMAFPIVDGKRLYGLDVWAAVGEVTEHRLDGRALIGKASVIEAACSTPGGLSGGPAFDKNGKVFGILSISNNDPDGRGPSQISMIWPALARDLSPAFLKHWMPANFRLLDLDDKLCGIDRRDVIRTSPDSNSGKTRMEWDHWT
jgi:hypothetical protein